MQILRQIVHEDAPPGRPSFSAEIIVTSNHAATHVDSFAHSHASADAPRIADMPLDTFCGEAVCVDVRQYPAGHGVTAAELEQTIEAGGLEVRGGDIVCFCTDHDNRTAGTPAFLNGFSARPTRRGLAGARARDRRGVSARPAGASSQGPHLPPPVNRNVGIFGMAVIAAASAQTSPLVGAKAGTHVTVVATAHRM